MNRRKIYIVILFLIAVILPSAIMLTNLEDHNILELPVSNIFLSNQANNKAQKATASSSIQNQPEDSSKTNMTSNKDSQKSKTASAKSFAQIVSDMNIKNFEDGLKILIDKSEHTLSIIYNGTNLKTYHVEFGSGGILDKEIQGDRRTPEGTFYVANKNVMNPPDYYLGSRWLGVSYPSIEDADRGLSKQLIDKDTHDDIVSAFKNGDMPSGNTALGGDIGIHGGSTPEFGSDWTWGCIGLANKDIEDFYDFIPVGTPIIIQK